MKNVEIVEGGIGRRLSGTKFVLTDKPNSDQMEVWVDEDDRKLERLYATQNGTYYPEDYDAYGFSSVTVSIHGGVALPEMPKIEFPDGIEYPALIPEIEMPDGTLKPIDELFPEIAEDPLTDIGEVKMPDTVGEEGSAITGIDPEDGYTYKVEVDENGNLDIEKVPTGISVTSPTQTEYEFGQPIDYDGMEVTLVDKDGNIVKTKEYPDGKVPLDEMEDGGGLPEKTQERDKIKGTWTVKTDVDVNIVGVSTMVSAAYTTYGQDETLLPYFVASFSWNQPAALLTASTSGFQFLVASQSNNFSYSYSSEIYARENDGTVKYIIHDSDSGQDTGVRRELNGKKFYICDRTRWTVQGTRINPSAQNNHYSLTDTQIGYYLLYGKYTAEETIPVHWKSVYSGVVYESGVTIVTSDPDDYGPNE